MTAVAPRTAPSRPLSPATRCAFLLAPGFLLLAWVVLWPLDGRAGPGPGWTVAHLAWVVAFGLLVPVALGLRRLVAARTRGLRLATDALTAAVLVGLVAGTGQMVVDLVAGFESSSRAAMDRASDRMTGAPGLDLVLYTLGPVLVLGGLVALLAVLAARRRVTWWAPVLGLLGLVLTAASDAVQALAPVGVAALWLALAAVAVADEWRARDPDGGPS